ncbi:MAG: IS1595 family transposase [Gammaproteobacteria bacterium]|nr:IS1595 family transposase [Gammaproteobacteria bacterium]
MSGERTRPGAMIYTDDARAYKGLPNHEAVKHSVSEYVRDQVHTNGIESFWSLLKRGYQGIYHKMSPKHLDRYVREYSHRHNVRECDTIDQMNSLVEGMRLKRLKYKDLIADNGLDSGARAA